MQILLVFKLLQLQRITPFGMYFLVSAPCVYEMEILCLSSIMLEAVSLLAGYEKDVSNYCLLCANAANDTAIVSNPPFEVFVTLCASLLPSAVSLLHLKIQGKTRDENP